MDDEPAPEAKTEPNDQPNFQWSGTGHAPAGEPTSPSGEEDEAASPTGNKAPTPAQKRRRVTRACDECRRKKIKCDGKQPCTHCTVYSYECTYDQPSNRRRNPTPQYIEALEGRLHRAEAILKALHIDVNDPNINLALAQNANLLKPPPITAPAGPVQSKSGNEGDSLLESMVQDTGSLDIDDEGHWDFHGHSSGMVFLQRLRQQFGDMLGKAEGIGTMLAKPMHYVPRSYTFDSPKSAAESPWDGSSTAHAELPPKEQGIYFCELSMSDACSLMRFIHKPTLWKMFHKIYNTPDTQWGNEEHRYLPLIFALMAVGTMFASPEDSKFQKEGYAGGIDDGFKWFKAAKQLLEITDCRDIPSVQAVVCMIMFLQSTAKLSTCWCYVGIALHSALRMGLHRSITANFNPVELESRRRLFWQIRKMDVYVGAMIGLPTMLSEDDIDQELPLDIDDEFITTERIKPAPPGHIHLMTGSNAQVRLMSVLRKVIKYVYPIKGVQYMEGKSRSYVVAHAKIREIERDLQHWMEELPMFLRPGGEVSPDLARVQQLLRMAYAYVQMFLYRPFLHYVSKTSHHPNTDKRSYACAAACVSVSRNVIHITQEMSKRGLLIGSFWFVMYTTFLAIMALVFFALENPESRSSEEIIHDAMTGRNILAGLAKNSMAADRCTQTLGVRNTILSKTLANFKKQLFDKIPERLKRGRAQSLSAPTPKKRQAASPIPIRSTSTNNQNPKVENQDPSSGLQRASTFPIKQPSLSSINASQPQQQAPYPSNINFADASLGPTTSDRNTSNDALTFSQLGIPTSKLPQATTYGIPDVSAMMFPSTDPFDYPNQPMTTLENDAFAESSTDTASVTSSSRRGPSPAHSSSLLFPISPQQRNHPAVTSAANGVNGVSTTGGYDPSLEAQIFDPLQPYLSGSAGYQQVLDGDLLADIGSMNGQGIGVGREAGKGGDSFGGDWWSSNGGGGWGL